MENKFFKYLPKKNQWIIILLIGILLVIIAIPTKTETDSGQNLGYEMTEAGGTEVEMRLENMLSKMQGVGKVHVMITFREEEQVQGILVIAEGGGNAVVVRNITEVVQALFDVDSHKIKVIERNSMN